MTRIARNLLSVFLLAVLAFHLPAAGTDPDVLYLTGQGGKPLRLRVLRDTQLNITRAPNTRLTVLARGQYVEVLAISKYQLQVRGRMSTGSVQGWVNRDDIAPISEETLNDLVQKEQKNKELQEAIKRKEVVFGMTRDQVQQMLGKPQDKSTVQEEDGVSETWTYYTYKSMPISQTYGVGTNVVTQVYTQKVPIGSKKITFQNGLVTRIEQKSENVQSGIQVPAAPYPPPVYWIPKTKSTAPGS